MNNFVKKQKLDNVFEERHPLQRDIPYIMKSLIKGNPLPWIIGWKKLWRTPWIMPLFRGEPLGLASGVILELWFEEVLDICLEEVRGLCLRDPWVTSGNNP